MCSISYAQQYSVMDLYPVDQELGPDRKKKPKMDYSLTGGSFHICLRNTSRYDIPYVIRFKF